MQDISLLTRDDIAKTDTLGEKSQNELDDVLRQYEIWYYEFNPISKGEEKNNGDLVISNAPHKQLVKIKNDFLTYGSYKFSI